MTSGATIKRWPEYIGSKKNEESWDCILRSGVPKIPEILAPHLGGNSPDSLYFLYQAIHASVACDLFAKTWSAICRSIHSIRDSSTVTFILGLFSDIKSHSILPSVLNRFEILVYSISFNEIGTPNDKSNSISESAEGTGHHTCRVDGMSRKHGGSRPCEHLPLGHPHPGGFSEEGIGGGILNLHQTSVRNALEVTT